MNLKYAHVEGERRYVLPRPLVILRRRRGSRRSKTITWVALGCGCDVLRREKIRCTSWGRKYASTSGIRGQSHTRPYLSRHEYEELLKLPSDVLRKTRLVAPIDGAMAGNLPVEPVAEVTEDGRFTGGSLACTSEEALKLTLAPFHKSGTRLTQAI